MQVRVDGTIWQIILNIISKDSNWLWQTSRQLRWSLTISFSFFIVVGIRWRGTLVAAKCIKSAKIRKEWAIKQALTNLEDGGDVDQAIQDIDEAEMSENEKDEACVFSAL